MWKCHKCGKPVYFAERKQSLGYDWHPECLRCEECGKRLNPGQHAEHKSIPYCHVPCYGALFGPQLFGHGTRVESHKSFGVTKGAVRSASGPSLPRDHLESKLKVYNQYFDNKSHEIRSREVNGRLVLEGALRVYWAVQGIIHLKEDDDQRTLVTVRKRNSCRYPNSIEIDAEQNSQQNASDKDINDTGIEICTSSIMGGGGVAGGGGDATDVSMTESISFDACSLSEDITTSSMTGGDSTGSSKEVSPEHRSLTLPSKLEQLNRNVEWDEIDDLLQVERKLDESEKRYQTMPSQSPSTQSMNNVEESQQEPALLEQQLPTTSEPNVDVVHTLSEINSNNQLIDNNNCINSNDNNNNNNKSSNNSNNILNDNHIGDDDLNSVSSASSTLKNIDYDEFRKKSQQEYINNTNELRTSKDDTLKSNQPIDPSRINDSLKLYSENIMSKSYSGCGITTTIDQALRVCPSTYQQYQTMNTIDPFKIHDTLSLIKNDPNNPQNHHRRHHNHHHYHNRNYLLQKSGSESSRSNYLSYDQNNDCNNNGNVDDMDCLNRGINRSKSGPNWYDNNYFDMDNSETLKPSSINHHQKESIVLDNLKANNRINIKMDCYDESTLKHLDNDVIDQIKGDEVVDSIVNHNNTNNNNLNDDDDDGSTTTTTIKNETENISDIKNDATIQNDEEDFLNNEKKNHIHNNTNNDNNDDDDNEVVLRHKPKSGSTAIKRRSGNKRSRAKLKRRCSINGHFYNRETSFFTPPHGAQMSVWITSLVTTTEVVNLLLEKYKVDSRPENFALFILRDNGEQRRLKDEDFPLIVRVMLGPHEDIARIFLTDSQTTSEISSEVAQFLNLSIPECRSILDRYTDEMEREVLKIKEKYADMRRRITQRMESLKVRL